MPSGSASLSLLSWGLNEEALLPTFFDRAETLLESCGIDWEIIFVNDGSTDATVRIANDRARRNPRIQVVHHATPQNIGPAFLKALTLASKDYVIWQTVDWSYDLRHLDIFLKLLKHFDVVVGVRPIPVRPLSHIPVLRSVYRVRSRSDNLMKAIVSIGNYYTVRILFGVPFHDFQSLMIFPRPLLQAMPLNGRTSFLGPEMLIRAWASGARFIEVPVRFLKRSTGEAKGTKLPTVLRAASDTFTNWARWGLSLRLRTRGPRVRQIFRVFDPFYLEEDVIRLVVPLFGEFRGADWDSSQGGTWPASSAARPSRSDSSK